ncbi:testis-specific gene A8 protein-like [Corvus moneduloides]|uniref:testis-specific gene A8 protein-like n=1 Tax=Corvus moneduloides TaxID=1196302 RepID=UPI00136276C7|nr:testis-specific gene A8 protein-like [Corvus moneduloides]
MGGNSMTRQGCEGGTVLEQDGGLAQPVRAANARARATGGASAGRAVRATRTPPPEAGDAAPSRETAWPAAKPGTALPRENPEAAVAAERRAEVAAPEASAENGPAVAPGASVEHRPETVVLSAPGERETAAEAVTAPNVAAVRETAAAPGAAIAPESAAASVPARSDLAETASRKETAVQTAAQPAASKKRRFSDDSGVHSDCLNMGIQESKNASSSYTGTLDSQTREEE